jgi:predicted DNA binding CopG/RHH family protein
MLIDVYNLPANLRAEIITHIIDPCVLVNLATDEDPEVRWRVACNQNTPPKVLEQLATDKNDNVRYWVAENPNTPPETLKILSTDMDWVVRCRVAKQPNTPPEILEVLASDVCFTVLKGVAENPKTPSAALEKIINKNFSTYIGLIEFDKNALIKTAKEHPNYKKSVNLDLSQSQLTALKNLIAASSDPYLRELFN